MKHLITITFTLITIVCFGQASFFTSGIIKSKYDTTVIFKGVDTVNHEHVYVAEKKSTNSLGYYSVCAAMHDEAGCSKNWLQQFEVCTICLKHIYISETRWVEHKKPAEHPKDKYKESLEILNKLKQKP